GGLLDAPLAEARRSLLDHDLVDGRCREIGIDVRAGARCRTRSAAVAVSDRVHGVSALKRCRPYQNGRTNPICAVLGKRMRSTAFLVAAFVGLGCGATLRPDGGEGLLPIGSTAPDLTAHDQYGKSHRLTEERGHAVVVYFYPKDNTPGCTKEACAFRD